MTGDGDTGSRSPRSQKRDLGHPASHATLATRNVKHFEDIAGSVVNPWDA